MLRWGFRFFLATLVLGLLACSGAKGGKAQPESPRAAEPCQVPDAGAADKGSKGYYQIGTCPVDEEEGSEVNDNE